MYQADAFVVPRVQRDPAGNVDDYAIPVSSERRPSARLVVNITASSMMTSAVQTMYVYRFAHLPSIIDKHSVPGVQGEDAGEPCLSIEHASDGQKISARFDNTIFSSRSSSASALSTDYYSSLSSSSKFSFSFYCIPRLQIAIFI